MATSGFWRKLARKFEQCDPNNVLRAEWLYVDDPNEVYFTLPGEYEAQHVQAKFNYLASSGGKTLSREKGDFVRRWRKEVLRFEYSPSLQEKPFQFLGYSGNEYRGCIQMLAQHSVTCCQNLARESLEDSKAQNTQHLIVPVQINTPLSIGQKIASLRKEFGWTIEQLAEKVELDRTTVSRHIAGKMMPEIPALRRYSRIFSKNFKKQIDISQTPHQTPGGV